MQDISRQIGIAMRWLPLVLVFAIAAGVVAYTYASSRPVVVEATGTLRVLPGPAATIQDRNDAVLAAVQYASEMEAPGFAGAIARKLGLDQSRDELGRRFSTDVDSDADVALIQLGVRSTNPQQAQVIAKAFGDELIRRKSNELYTPAVRDASQQVRRLESDADALRRRLRNVRNKSPKTAADFDEIASLPGEIAELQQAIVDLRPFTGPYIRNRPGWIVEPRLPSESVAAGPLYWTLLATVVGGMLAVGLAFVIEYLRSVGRVREERDLELATGQVSLGTVLETDRDAKRASDERLVMLHYPRSDEAEAYRGLVARIGFSGGSARAFMVASARSTDTQSLVAANIAVAFAEAGRNVVLVDADYRSPHIHSFFGVKNDRGLTSILTDSNTPLGWATVPSPHPRLGLMTSGPMPPENAEPLGSHQLNALLRRLLQAADVVIFDSPSTEASLDAAVLARELQTLLVVPRNSKEDEVAAAAQKLAVAESEFIGAVLYRKVRRSRKGARAKLAPAPQGWGPTWPMLYDQPARIPAAVRTAAQGVQTGSGGALPASVAVPRQQGSSRPPDQRQTEVPQRNDRATGPAVATGPYSTSFRAEPVRPTVPASEQPSPAPPAAPAQAGPQAVAQAKPSEQRGPGRPSSAPRTPAPSEGDPRIAIPVQPQPSQGNGSSAQTRAGEQAGTAATSSPDATNPESVPG